jgi:RNA polymerase sigma-70 factor (ECF subfamily)
MKSRGMRDETQVKFVASTTTDNLLIPAAKAGDHSAFMELWMRHSRRAFRMVYRIMGNRDDAEDVLQDTWMKAYVHLNTFNERAQFSTWLTRIAINSALMTLRRRRSHPETAMDVADGEIWRAVRLQAKRRTLTNSMHGTKA